MAEVTISTGGEQTGSGGSGSVTSIDVSGGTTGLTSSGGPITTSGTITLAGTLAIANGGSGQTTANAAFNALSPNTTRGDISVRNATVNARLALGAAGTILRSDGTDLVYSTATYPNTTTANQILYSSATNTLGGSSNFTFNGTSVGIGGTISSTARLTINRGTESCNLLEGAKDTYITKASFGSHNDGGGQMTVIGSNFYMTDAGAETRYNTGLAAWYMTFGQRSDLWALRRIASGGGASTEFVTVNSSGNMGIGVTSPTAALHLKAGTATANTAPLKFNSGTSLTSAEAGAVEFTTDDLFFTITTGTARKRLLMADVTGGLTSGRIAYATTNGRLTDSSGLTFDGTNFTTTGSVTTTQVIASNKGINTTAGDSATINAMAGRFRKDATGETFTLTNSFITANSIILLTWATTGITGGTKTVVVAGSGSATITFEDPTTGIATAPSADADINFLVVN